MSCGSFTKYLVVTLDKYHEREIQDSFNDEADAMEEAERLGNDYSDQYETILIYKAISVGERAKFTFTKVK